MFSTIRTWIKWLFAKKDKTEFLSLLQEIKKEPRKKWLYLFNVWSSYPQTWKVTKTEKDFLTNFFTCLWAPNTSKCIAYKKTKYKRVPRNFDWIKKGRRYLVSTLFTEEKYYLTSDQFAIIQWINEEMRLENEYTYVVIDRYKQINRVKGQKYKTDPNVLYF